jgi:hypothetical protein
MVAVVIGHVLVVMAADQVGCRDFCPLILVVVAVGGVGSHQAAS